MGKSNIGWTDHSTNPYGWACNPVSPGCQNCYAMAFTERQGKVFKRPPEWKGDDWFERELRKIKPGERTFINAFSDTFHHKAPLEWIQKIFDAAKRYPQVTLLILTKRIERAFEWQFQLKWQSNIWIGTSVESGDFVRRIDYLRGIQHPNRFISFEPLIGKVGKVNLDGIGWVITGGESGPNRRYFNKAWALEIVDQAKGLDIPVYHKQGSAFKPGEDRILAGRTWDEFPAGWDAPVHQVQTVPEQLSLFEGE